MGQRDADNKVKCEEEAGESPLWQLAASLCYGAERLREKYTKFKLHIMYFAHGPHGQSNFELDILSETI